MKVVKNYKVVGEIFLNKIIWLVLEYYNLFFCYVLIQRIRIFVRQLDFEVELVYFGFFELESWVGKMCVASGCVQGVYFGILQVEFGIGTFDMRVMRIFWFDFE